MLGCIPACYWPAYTVSMPATLLTTRMQKLYTHAGTRQCSLLRHLVLPNNHHTSDRVPAYDECIVHSMHVANSQIVYSAYKHASGQHGRLAVAQYKGRLKLTQKAFVV